MAVLTVFMVVTFLVQLFLAAIFHHDFLRGVTLDPASMGYRAYFYDKSVWIGIIVNALFIGRAALDEIPCWFDLLLKCVFSYGAYICIFVINFLDWRVLSHNKKRSCFVSCFKGCGGSVVSEMIPEGTDDLEYDGILAKARSRQILIGNFMIGTFFVLNTIVASAAMAKSIYIDESMTSADEACNISGEKWYLGGLLAFYSVLAILAFALQFATSRSLRSFLLKESFLVSLSTLFLFLYHTSLSLDLASWMKWSDNSYHPDLLLMWGVMASLQIEVGCCFLSFCVSWPTINRLISNVRPFDGSAIQLSQHVDLIPANGVRSKRPKQEDEEETMLFSASDSGGDADNEERKDDAV